MAHIRNHGHQNPRQKNFQCEFCPTRNSWVRLLTVKGERHLICPECIAELARQIRLEKAKNNDAETRVQIPDSTAPGHSVGGVGNLPIQTETPANES